MAQPVLNYRGRHDYASNQICISVQLAIVLLKMQLKPVPGLEYFEHPRIVALVVEKSLTHIKQVVIQLAI